MCRTKLVLMWVPSHVSLTGNSVADSTSFAALLMPVTTPTGGLTVPPPCLTILGEVLLLSLCSIAAAVDYSTVCGMWSSAIDSIVQQFFSWDVDENFPTCGWLTDRRWITTISRLNSSNSCSSCIPTHSAVSNRASCEFCFVHTTSVYKWTM